MVKYWDLEETSPDVALNTIGEWRLSIRMSRATPESIWRDLADTFCVFREMMVASLL